MARRPAFTPDAAREYLRSRGQPVPNSDVQAQRLARGLSQGKTPREAYGHGRSEHQYRRARANEIQLSLISRSKTEYKMGPTPDTDVEPEDAIGAIRVPQPADLERLIRRTKGPLIVVGLYGYLITYAEAGDQYGDQYVYVHTYVYKSQVLDLLAQLPRDHTYTADDPGYLDLAHNLVAGDTHGQFNAANVGWQWGWIYQWSVRDIT